MKSIMMMVGNAKTSRDRKEKLRASALFIRNTLFIAFTKRLQDLAKMVYVCIRILLLNLFYSVLDGTVKPFVFFGNLL